MVVPYFLSLLLKSPIKILKNILLKLQENVDERHTWKKKYLILNSKLTNICIQLHYNSNFPCKKSNLWQNYKLIQTLFFFFLNKLINLPYFFWQFYTIGLLQDS